MEFFFDDGFFNFEFSVFPEGLFVGVDDEESIIAVEKDGIAIGELGSGVVKADDGGDIKRSCHDRGVGCFATDIGGESEHEISVELCGI